MYFKDVFGKVLPVFTLSWYKKVFLTRSFIDSFITN